jgi:branched-chain amino acid transport system ATP-binding protein
MSSSGQPLSDESLSDDPGQPLLEVDQIDVFYDDVQVLHRLSFEVRRGEIVTLLGSNGAGKTTTLRAIMG